MRDSFQTFKSFQMFKSSRGDIEERKYMDFKLTEEQKLIRNTAAQFVQRELLPREGAYLKQEELFLPPAIRRAASLIPIFAKFSCGTLDKSGSGRWSYRNRRVDRL